MANCYQSAYRLRFIKILNSELIKSIMGNPVQPQSPTMAVPSESLHQDRSNISLGGLSVDDLIYLDEQQAIGNSSKEFTKSPEDKDLLSRFQVACIIINRMMGMSPRHTPACLCSDYYSHIFRDWNLRVANHYYTTRSEYRGESHSLDLGLYSQHGWHSDVRRVWPYDSTAQDGWRNSSCSKKWW